MADLFFVHPHALCDSKKIGQGTKIWAFTHVMPDVRIGNDCNVGENVFIESGAQVGHRVTIKNQVLIWEGVLIEDDVFIGPGVIFTNDRYPRSPRIKKIPEIDARYKKKNNWLEKTKVCTGASIGSGALIMPGLTIGPYAMIGGGAVVTKNVKPHALILGNPGRASGFVCYCGNPLKKYVDLWDCRNCKRRFNEHMKNIK